MQTITFYSYKGGAGRTLAVANITKYLARFGKKVFALDFDLEAPGLHYKLGVDRQTGSSRIKLGLLDYVYAFAVSHQIPGSLRQYVVEVEHHQESGGSIYLMPSGNCPSASYWRRLAQINWHELVYSEVAKGIPFFLELKELINKEFAPDFLLIDSRTGVTEIGGIATTLLPDKLVCLLLNNQENLEGVREVLRSIKQAPRLPGQTPIELLPVVSRIPEMRKPDIEETMVSEIRDFLNEKAVEPSRTLNISEVFILHSEPDLQISESLRIGGEKSLDESPLLRDYLRLFARLIPKDVLEPHVGVLVQSATARALDDPDGAQRDLEALAATCPHAAVYHALIKFYRLRKAEDQVVLRAASRFWDLADRADDPLLWQVVKAHYARPRIWKDYSVRPEFIQHVFEAAGATDIEIGLQLAEHYDSLGQGDQAAKVLLRLLEKTGTADAEKVVVRSIDQLRKLKEWPTAFEIIERYKSILNESTSFQTAWARLVVSKGDKSEAEMLARTLKPRVETLEESEMGTYTSLLSLSGRTEELNTFMDLILTRALAQGPSPVLTAVGEIFIRYGRRREYDQRVRQSFGAEGEGFLRNLYSRLSPRHRMFLT